jgi:leucyl aminopeptidase
MLSPRRVGAGPNRLVRGSCSRGAVGGQRSTQPRVRTNAKVRWQAVQVSFTTELPIAAPADTVAIGVFDGEGVAHDTAGGELSTLLHSGEARSDFKSLALTRAQGRRWLLVGLGRREQFDAERARVAAAVAHERASEIGTLSLCWEVPHHVAPEVAAALVEGTKLGAYRFERFRRRPPEDAPRGPAERLIVSAHDPLDQVVQEAALVAEAVNAARDLQNRPANDLTPTALGRAAVELADEVAGLSAEVEGREALERRRMGAFAAVARGSDQEPALITLRYTGAGSEEANLALVGKAVTFDSGGISIKPSAKMAEMKFDMSGGAAVLQAAGAIARLRLPVNIIAVIGATENLPSGHAVKPGDIVTAANGTTIEVNNTDAEGRLVLADCLSYAVSLGARRIVDIATLTGAVVVALGSTFAGLMSNDDSWAELVLDAGTRSGERLWRLPLHEEYAALVRGRYADLDNSPEERKAGTIVGAEFLRHFVGEASWAHVDIAGCAWNLGRPYASRGGAGFGVRLLVEVARAHAGR